jgi:hypothetical protein
MNGNAAPPPHTRFCINHIRKSCDLSSE